MKDTITPASIALMQESADTGLRAGGLALILAEHVNDLLDERARVILPELARVTGELGERANELARMAVDRDKWRASAELCGALVRAAELVVKAANAGAVRALLLTMSVGELKTIRGVTLRRMDAKLWSIGPVKHCTSTLDHCVDRILAQGK